MGNCTDIILSGMAPKCYQTNKQSKSWLLQKWSHIGLTPASIYGLGSDDLRFNCKGLKMRFILKSPLLCEHSSSPHGCRESHWFQRKLCLQLQCQLIAGKGHVGRLVGESCLSLICEVLSKFQPKRFFSEVVWSVSATWGFPDRMHPTCVITAVAYILLCQHYLDNACTIIITNYITYGHEIL